MIDIEQHGEIRRKFYVDHWKVGEIASEFGLHPDTIKRALNRSYRINGKIVKKSLLDPYKDFLKDYLEKHPQIKSTRLFNILRKKGYEGGPRTIQRYVKNIRPKAKEAFYPLTFLPGEQAQVDWGAFGSIEIGKAKRKLSCFVMRLSYSRAIYARFTTDEKAETFFSCHQKAFEYFKGIPRVLLYDNLRTCVSYRIGTLIHFNEKMLCFASDYHFEPKACKPRKGNEKGRVERGIRFIRNNYGEDRTYSCIHDANEQILDWCINEGINIPWFQDKTRKVREVFIEEQKYLENIPDGIGKIHMAIPVVAQKYPLVRFDRNEYSIPHEYVGINLTLEADEKDVWIKNANSLLASHKRSYDQGRRIVNEEHIRKLLIAKKQLIPHYGREKILYCFPQCIEVFHLLLKRGEPLQRHVKMFLQMMDKYSTREIWDAIDHALILDKPYAWDIERMIREKRSKDKVLPSIDLPKDLRVQNQHIKKKSMVPYDQLGEQ